MSDYQDKLRRNLQTLMNQPAKTPLQEQQEERTQTWDEAYARGVSAERARCARVAREARHRTYEGHDAMRQVKFWTEACEAIAAAIEEGE